MSGDAFSFKGLVVSSLEFKDNDRILTVLTSDLGCISVIAKGVTKNNSKHAYLCMPFLLCDFTVTFSKGYYYLKEADIIQNNVGISSSLEATTVAFHISEIIKFASFDNIATADIYELTNYAFYHLSRVPDDYKLVYSAFNWRLLFLM
ncbi:MAG: DNA repair protein RecO, partial [Clostridia bacterium]|nr:DNA repair protein RecO [Clostridia bacterium]